MKKITVLLVSALASGSLLADTIELADGRTLEGDFIGASNGIMMFDTGAGIEAFPEDQVVGLFLSSGVETAMDMAEVSPTEQITVPQGTRLVIRMSETVDSSRHQAGHRFRAQLDGAIVIDGITVVPRATQMQGQITSAGQAGRLAGSSNLAVQFTDFILDDQFVPIATGTLSAQGGSEGGNTVRRTARAAAIGGLIDGSSGARTGARVGVGASILTSGQSINIPRGTIIETSLSVPVQITIH